MDSWYMKLRGRTRAAFALIGVIAIAMAVLVYLQISKQPVAPTISHSISKTAPSAEAYYRGLPTRLKIASIGVDAAIEYMGTMPSGDMAVPSGSVDVGWYRYGPIPGDTGSSVIAGHIIGSRGEQGVFFHLNKLQIGDVLEVTDAKGKVASFTVSRIKTYDQTQQPAEVFNSSSGVHLNLITCAGDWDQAQRHYLKRLVVFADKSASTTVTKKLEPKL